MTKATKIEGLERFLCICWHTFTVEGYDEERSKGLRERVMRGWTERREGCERIQEGIGEKEIEAGCRQTEEV